MRNLVLVASRRPDEIPQLAWWRTARELMRHAPSRIVATIREWHWRRDGRALLASLDERTLRDIGLTRSEVSREIIKPFWTP